MSAVGISVLQGGEDVKISKHDLLRELSAVQSVVERKTTIPILSNVLFEAAANHSLAITGTDLDQSMRTSCPAKVRCSKPRK